MNSSHALVAVFSVVTTTLTTSTNISTSSSTTSGETTSSTTTISVIRGIVYGIDEYGNLRPLRSAQVTALNEHETSTVTSTTTDGAYTLWVPAGSYNVTASLQPAFIPQSKMVIVGLAEASPLDFDLESSGIPCTTCSVTTTQSTTAAATTVAQTTQALQMQVSSNSTVSGLIFDLTRGILNLTVSGPEGTHGFLDATIAKSLLSGQPLVLIDGVQYVASVSEDLNFWYIHIIYTQSQHHVTIGGSNTAPEFPSIPLLTIVLLLALVTVRRRRRHIASREKITQATSMEEAGKPQCAQSNPLDTKRSEQRLV
jgi:hypothetical protein